MGERETASGHPRHSRCGNLKIYVGEMRARLAACASTLLSFPQRVDENFPRVLAMIGTRSLTKLAVLQLCALTLVRKVVSTPGAPIVTPLTRARRSMSNEEIEDDIQRKRDFARNVTDIDHVLKCNRAWRRMRMEDDPNFFSRQTGNHHPSYLWIGCADARVPATDLMGSVADNPGVVFVHRNIANMVLNTDANIMSVLQYAVDYLKVPHIIVCGHYDCGGVKAACSTNDHGAPLESWLRHIRDVRRIHRIELDSIIDPDEHHRRLVELNVVEQCLNLYKTSVMQKKIMDYQEAPGTAQVPPRIHGCVYDPGTGKLKLLHIDLEGSYEYISDIYDIYDIYRPDGNRDISGRDMFD